MKLSELKIEVDKAIEEGYGDITVYFDTEARTYNVHLVPIKSFHTLEENIVDEDKYVVISSITPT